MFAQNGTRKSIAGDFSEAVTWKPAQEDSKFSNSRVGIAFPAFQVSHFPDLHLCDQLECHWEN